MVVMDEVTASLSGKCCKCKQPQQGKYVFEDQSTLKIYCKKHRHSVPRKAELVEIKIPAVRKSKFSMTFMRNSTSASSDEDEGYWRVPVKK